MVGCPPYGSCNISVEGPGFRESVVFKVGCSPYLMGAIVCVLSPGFKE